MHGASKLILCIAQMDECYFTRYDLMIADGDNVSESPGFEPCLGIFGGSS
jgi:hypothetical protein